MAREIPLDFTQPGGFLFEDFERLIAEPADNPTGKRRPDALDGAGGEVFEDGAGGGGQLPLADHHLELVAVDRVGAVLPHQPDNLPLGHPRHLADRGDELPLAVDFEHRKTGGLVVKDHRFNIACDRFEFFLPHSPPCFR